MWYPTDKGEYINLEQAISLKLEKVNSKFLISARFSLSSKNNKIVLKTLDDEEEAIRLMEWIIKDLNKHVQN